jgi:phosphodiesterase/alkaline phosphatase D-like protein
MASGPARVSFFEYVPIRPDAEGRIYRSFRFGKLAEIFILDDRSYRDDNIVPDGAGKVIDVRLANGEHRQLRGKAKTMLGTAQREWLLKGLREAEARGVMWKIISTDDPLSSVTGSYQLFSPEGPMTPLYMIRDGWAAGVRLNTDRDGNQANPLGVESELRAILAAVKAAGVKNVVWLATDVHFARLLRYEPMGDLAGLIFHEFIAGPANAVSAPPGPMSRTFNPIELFARGRRPDPARPSFSELWRCTDCRRRAVDRRDPRRGEYGLPGRAGATRCGDLNSDPLADCDVIINVETAKGVRTDGPAVAAAAGRSGDRVLTQPRSTPEKED